MDFSVLFGNIANITWQQAVMWLIGALLIYLAIKKQMEPSLLLPMGFGVILVNLPMSGAITQVVDGETEVGILKVLHAAGIANELFPLLLFIGIGAMIDFGPLLTNPKMLLFGAAGQVGIFLTLILGVLIGFDLIDAASIGIIGAADGPTAFFVANLLGSKYTGAIIVVAYSYMALVPIIQPPVIKLLTTKKERKIPMVYKQKDIPQIIKILFPVFVTMISGFVAPRSVSLVAFIMFGNLIRECGVLRSLSETAQTVLANLITILLGITVSLQMKAEQFLVLETLFILLLGLLAFIFDTAGGILLAKFMNLFTKKKINPIIGAAGISAFPMASRVAHKIGRSEDPNNFLLMHAVGANMAGQIASVIAGGLLVSLVTSGMFG